MDTLMKKYYVSCEIEIVTFENYQEDVLKVSEWGTGFDDDDFGGSWD